MKTKFLKFAIAASLPLWFACSTNVKSSSAEDSTDASSTASSENNGSTVSYVSLNSGSGGSSTIIRDTVSGGYVYSETSKPIDADLLFVEASTGDTLYGPTGQIVNNAVIQQDGTWKLDETKIKRDGDKIKVKSGNDKLKIDDEETKMKTGDSKVKTDADDPEAKIKTPDSKTKVEDDETKVKPQ